MEGGADSTYSPITAVNGLQAPSANGQPSFTKVFISQIRLLIWKRYCESTKTKLDIMKVAVPPLLFFLVTLLLYKVFDGLFSPGGIEAYLLIPGFWIYIQRIVVQILYEKGSRLQESMKMMGLYESTYWISYFITDGIILGFLLSFICALISLGGMFNDGGFGPVLGLLFIFCLSSTSFSFFLASFSDNAQFGTQSTITLLMGLYVVFAIIFIGGSNTISLRACEIILCFFPPTAFQIGCLTFLKSYDGIPLSSVCGIMFADIFIYAALAWYFTQVWPTSVGVPKPFYFIFMKSYWFPNATTSSLSDAAYLSSLEMNQAKVSASDRVEEGSNIPVEQANEAILGAPTIQVKHLYKTYGQNTVVNDLSFKMYENQIFALLGHNGAGKTTTISILTGLFAPNTVAQSSASIYGFDIERQLPSIRRNLGVCPQYDVLFEKLSIEEHILFFAQLKGKSYEEAKKEADYFINLFHLKRRRLHLGSELSGGQKRKLSVAIAVCGGSKFVVLDEPTAGMDPLARRELWDLLSSLRKGRSMLLTTHYMDEADVLGDRIGIMSHGKMQCCGSSQFLKTKLGIGYRLIFDKNLSRSIGGIEDKEVDRLTNYVQRFIPDAQYLEEPGQDTVIIYALPFSAIESFGRFFQSLEKEIQSFSFVKEGFNVMITTLEDVFLKVGQDHTVTPKNFNDNEGEEGNKKNIVGIGLDRAYEPTFLSQTIGIINRRLLYAWNDWFTIALLLLPILTAILSVILYTNDLISNQSWLNNIAVIGVCIGGYIGIPGLIAEFIVRERSDKLRNILNVMGCSYQAYWIGTFIADYLLLFVSLISLFICWGSGNMNDFYEGGGGLNFLLWLFFFPIQLLSFSYAHSFLFISPKTCLWSMLAIILLQALLPQTVLLIGIQIFSSAGGSISATDRAAILWWVSLIVSPYGGVYIGSLNAIGGVEELSGLPSLGASIAFMIAQTVFFTSIAYYIDIQSSAMVLPNMNPTDVDEEKMVEQLDEDVKEERIRTLKNIPNTTLFTSSDGAKARGNNNNDENKNDHSDIEANNNNAMDPLVMQRLRKVFPAKDKAHSPVVAVEDLSFAVGKGEIFGLLGANGAGKTTALSMLTRLLLPSSGNAYVTGQSILTDFPKASIHLGIVTQNNSLWDRLTVENHLYLFARLRGIPEDLVKDIVEGTIDQLELTPHRYKLAMNLSGGMKRKLCVAIALIGDPEVVLLDEPSAGLDPVSRRNLWTVILRTMSNRSVILTTHSMEEAEALCRRIGIMVQGQLRALGSKLHLKNKFGSGYELTIKLTGKNIQEEVKRLTGFIESLFPSCSLLSENGGLITYQIMKEEMKMSLIFQKLYDEKKNYCIEEFTIAQPTLEQVFIRIINKHTPVEDLYNNDS
mmetsp:Transcript_13128/g.14208  ORF Transcript_13128/g.14208 Transcript_13128/m.14208 type:complete len:1376 (-) Transcript_13128:742-4869(-)